MRIFVAFGYNERDHWIPTMVTPIVRAFGDEFVTGEEMAGEVLSEGVIERIKGCEALIGFLTRRGEPDAEGVYKTHRWVSDEISQAIALKKFVVEVREDRVDAQGGVAGDRQRIPYNEPERDRCLVEIVKAIGLWHRASRVKLQLLPADFAKEIFPYLNQNDIECKYSLLVNGDIGEPFPTKIVPISQGLFVLLTSVPPDALIQVSVRYKDRHWSSSFEGTDSLGIQMREMR
jgi:hypothetical protein